MFNVQRLVSSLLCACFALIGAGALKHLHNFSHASPAIAEAQAAPERHPAPLPADHERDCPLHLMLASPLLAPDADVVVGEAMVRWTLQAEAAALVASRLPARVDCRGPPVC